jgi:hypothetical protein
MQAESAAVASVTQRKTIMYTMRMEPRVKAAAEKAAAHERRSLAALIEMLLIDLCEERGFLKPERPRRKPRP